MVELVEAGEITDGSSAACSSDPDGGDASATDGVVGVDQ